MAWHLHLTLPAILAIARPDRLSDSAVCFVGRHGKLRVVLLEIGGL